MSIFTPSMWTLFTDWRQVSGDPCLSDIAHYYWLHGALWGVLTTLVMRMALGHLLRWVVSMATRFLPAWRIWARRKAIAKARARHIAAMERASLEIDPRTWDEETDPG